MGSFFRISEAVLVRCFLVTHAVVSIWYVTYQLEMSMYWLLLCLLAPLVVESFYTIIRRRGRDFSRFTPCFMFYLAAVLPGIWLLELDNTEQAIRGDNKKTTYFLNANIQIPGAPRDVWLIVIEELMPYIIFISRWILPRGRVTRQELAELLISFIEIGTDIMEFFALISQDVVRKDIPLVCLVLAVWSVSVLQFTMTITVIHSPKSKKPESGVNAESKEGKKWQKAKREIYAIFLSIIMQDLPFVIIRMYLIIRFNLIEYSLVFFTIKNFLKMVLLLHKAAVRCIAHYSPDSEEDDPHKVSKMTHHGHVKVTRSGHVKKNSFSGSLTMLPHYLSGKQLNSDYSQLPDSVGDSEPGVNKRSRNSRQRNHTSHDKEHISAEIKDTLFFQHELTHPRSYISAAVFRPSSFGYFSEQDVKFPKSYEKFVDRNNRSSQRITKEYKSVNGELISPELQLAHSKIISSVPVSNSQTYGIYSNLRPSPHRANVDSHGFTPINTHEDLLHSTPYQSRKKRGQDRDHGASYRTPVLSSEDAAGRMPPYANSSHVFMTETPVTLLPDSAFESNLPEPLPDYDMFF